MTLDRAPSTLARRGRPFSLPFWLSTCFLCCAAGSSIATLTSAHALAADPAKAATSQSSARNKRAAPAPPAAQPQPPKPSTSEGQQFLELAAYYERIGNSDAAIAAYQSALKSPNEQVWRQALVGIEKHRQNSWLERVISSAERHAISYGRLFVQAIVYVGLTALMLIALRVIGWFFPRRMFWWIRLRICRRRPRLRIMPLSSGRSGEAGTTSFEAVVASMLRGLERHGALGGPHLTRRPSTNPQMRAESLIERASSAAFSIVPTARPIVDPVLRALSHPEYVVEGSLFGTEEWQHVLVNLTDHGKIKRTWSETFHSKDALARMKDIAYELLRLLMYE